MIGDIIFSQHSTVIIVKLSITLQDGVKTASILIPVLGSSDICPVAALSQMLMQYDPKPINLLFQIKTKSGFTPLIDSVTRKHLKQVSLMLNTLKTLILHGFRRAGAMWAFRRGVSIQDIQVQGTWFSDCVWRYIQVSRHFLPGFLLHFRHTYTHDIVTTSTWHLGLASSPLHLYDSNTIYSYCYSYVYCVCIFPIA